MKKLIVLLLVVMLSGCINAQEGSEQYRKEPHSEGQQTEESTSLNNGKEETEELVKKKQEETKEEQSDKVKKEQNGANKDKDESKSTEKANQPEETTIKPDQGEQRAGEPFVSYFPNCKLFALFGQNIDDIKDVLGPPDDVIWFRGDVFIWEDASSLIGNNPDGLSQQKRLMVGGEDIAGLHLTSFGELETGIPNEEVIKFFESYGIGAEFSNMVPDKELSLIYVFNYNNDDYTLYINSDSEKVLYYMLMSGM